VRAVLRVDSRLRGATEAIRCMSRLAKLCFRYLCDRGFYIGIDDVTPLKRMLSLKQDILRGGHTRLAEFISNPDVMPWRVTVFRTSWAALGCVSVWYFIGVTVMSCEFYSLYYINIRLMRINAYKDGLPILISLCPCDRFTKTNHIVELQKLHIPLK